MKNVLLHIPHASLEVPERFFEGLTISKAAFRRYNLEMSDIGIDELFRDVPGERIIAPYSRLYCDVERFRDNAKEPMFSHGEGVIYTHAYDGTRFHQHDDAYCEEVLAYYDQVHEKLGSAAAAILEREGSLLLIDCHSFSDKMASHFYNPPFPDVCIGIEQDYYDAKIVETIISEVSKRGYTYRINYPYAGSMVPSVVLSGKLSGKITSVMLEINKRIYL